MKKLLFLLLLWPGLLAAQSTYTAASCNQAAVQTAINNEQAAKVDGDIISIPAGSCTWNSGTPISQTFTNSVTIQGAGAISATTGGASTTGSDSTAITNNEGSDQPVMVFTTTAGKSFRFTGIAILENATTANAVYNGSVQIQGLSSSVRVDHCHFLIFINGSKGLGFLDGVTGVADHLYINTAQSVTNNFVFQNGGKWNGDTGGYGNGSWADGDHFGSAEFMYVEDTNINGGYGSDCAEGGRWVLRHSTVINTNGMEQHGTPDQYRSCRASEVYLNTFTTSAGTSGGIIHNNGGTDLVWGNTITGFQNAIDLSYYRITGVPYGNLPVPPNGWGMCGTVTNGPSVWDQNVTGNGYACLDLPARGQGDLLTNFNSGFSDILNSTTSTRTWPHQALSPIYAWENTLASPGPQAFIGNAVSILADNVDYYQSFDASFGETGSFNGTKGINQSSAAPSGTCTVGVGWWETTNNTLYVCNPTNTWTTYYTPYTYPHPLTGGTPTAATPSCTPTSGNVPQSVTCSNSSSAIMCYTTNGMTPATNGSTGCTTGTLYSASIIISVASTLKIIAGGTGFLDSSIASYTYTSVTVVTIPKSFFGMTQGTTANPLASNTVQFGIGRLWDTTCVWPTINTAVNTFTYSTACDASITNYVNAGARPDFVFGRTPSWDLMPGATCTGSYGTGCAQRPADLNTGNATIIAMVNSLVSHLASAHPGVHWIMECVNEADLSGEWENDAGTAHGTMADLVTYCTALKNAAHAADSQIIVLGPSGSSLNSSNVHLYNDGNNYAGTAGAAASMDAINFHDYLESCSTFCTVPESIVGAMTQVNNLTKTGQPLAGFPVYISEGNWGGGSNDANMTAAQKRQYLTRNYLYALWQNANTTSQTNLVSKMWYAWDSSPNNLAAGFGTLCEGTPATACTPNQAATAMATLENWLIGATYTSPSTTAFTKDVNGTWTFNLLSSPASRGPAEIIFNPTTTPSITVASYYTLVLNWDGTTTPIVGNKVTAGPDPVMAITLSPIIPPPPPSPAIMFTFNCPAPVGCQLVGDVTITK